MLSSDYINSTFLFLTRTANIRDSVFGGDQGNQEVMSHDAPHKQLLHSLLNCLTKIR